MKQMYVWNFLTWLLPSTASVVWLIGRRVSHLLNCIKKIANRTFSTGCHLRHTPIPIWTYAACSVGGAVCRTSYFRSSKPSDCHMCKSWWAWVLIGEVRLNFKIMLSLLWPYKMKKMSPTKTREICLVYPWESPPQCTWCKQALM
jgi:hypothetical protein